MGVVYRARDEVLGRDVAVKFLPQATAVDEKGRKRLLREARLASSLSHPNICSVYDAGEHEGQTYIVLEYIPGETLANKLKHGRFDTGSVYRLGKQIADALACAHKHDIIHRDLKSSNIIVTPEQQVKIVDFGLASLSPLPAGQKASVSTQSGGLRGTLPYSAPEVLSGATPSREADIWSLGVVLYEMVTRRLPFQGDNLSDIVSAIQRQKPAAFDQTADATLAGIILRCLEKDPKARFRSADEVRVALETATYGSEVSTVAQPDVSRGARHFRKLAFISVLLLLFLTAVLIPVYLSREADRDQISSIAVLPLANLSGDPNQEYFADGMTDMLITDLGKISALRVISRTSMMTYKGKAEPIREIGRDLNLDAVVEGAVLRSGSHVEITARLIRTKTDSQIWSKTYSGEIHDVLTLQSQVAQAIADSIRIRLTPQEHARIVNARQINPDALDAYLMGRSAWEKRTPEALSESLKDFQQAISIQPDYALAYAGLADCYNVLGNNGFLSPKEAFPKAEAAALKALSIDDDLAEAHASLAFAHWNFDYDWDFIEREYRRAIELNPGYANAYHWYSGLLVGMGRSTEAIAAIRKARELDPLSPRIMANVGLILYFAHQYDDAVNELTKARQFDSSGAPDEYLAMSYVELQEYEPAIAAAERNCKLPGAPVSYQLDWAYALARAGKAEKARNLLKQVLARKDSSYVPALWISRVYVALGELDTAMNWLEQASEERSPQLTFLAVDPRFEAARSNPRFQMLLRQMRLDKVQLGNVPTPTT